MSLIVRLARALLSRVGLDVSRRKDPFNLNIYEKLFPVEVLAARPFYNVGAGRFHHPYWTNIDFISDWYGNRQKDLIHHDLTQNGPLPIESGSAKIIYTSHTIEHVKDESVAVLFAEAYRSLEKGGVFRVTTGPDAETDFRALMLNDESWFFWDEFNVSPGTFESIYHRPATSVPLAERWLHHVASQLAPNDISPSEVKLGEREILRAIDEYGFPEVLDYLCGLCEFQSERPGNHVSWWTHDKVIEFLKPAGFESVYRSGFGQSASPLLRNSPLFDSTWPQMSIYVEAVK